MKNYFVLLLSIALLSSCTTHTYHFMQVFETKSSSGVTNTAQENGGFSYEDSNCGLFYSFWAENGNASFGVYNKSNEILYVDLYKSFFIINGVANDYYKDVLPKLQKVISIPPHTSRIIAENTITSELFLDCNLDRFPSERASITFTETDSPLKFTNYVTYRLGNSEQDNLIENTFYVSKITNYASPSAYTFVERGKRPCQNLTNDDSKYYKEEYPVRVYDKVYTFYTGNCFYLEYEKRSDRELYKNDGKIYFYDPEYDGYTASDGKSSNSDYRRRLLNPFGK